MAWSDIATRPGGDRTQTLISGCGYDRVLGPGGIPAMTNAALRTLLPIAGWPEERADAIEFTGGTDPILPTPFRIGETAAAALAATGLAVSDLWELRTGRRQDIRVDARQATASLRSS